jgi:hypothetical protein
MCARNERVVPPTNEPNKATPSALPVCRVAFSTSAAMPDRDFSARFRPSRKKLAGTLARGSGCYSSPPEGFLDFQSDVAPGQPDIMQVAVGPLRQFAALPNPVALPEGSRTLWIATKGFSSLNDHPPFLLS